MHRPRSTHLLLIPLVALLAVTAGCGDDDTDEATNTESSETTAADTGDGDAIEVVAVDYGYDGLPEQVEAGTTLRLRNASEQEAHELVAFALPASEERTVDELMALPQEELGALLAGPPATVLIAAPDEEGFPAVGDGALADPGRYLVFCAIPTGADPEDFLAAAQESDNGPPQVDGGPPHFTQGMYAELRVG